MENKIIGAYEAPPLDIMNKRFIAIEKLWKDFLISEGLQSTRYHIHKRNMYEVIKRQDQRMHYYKIFHGLLYPCEYKYVAIECFWINTLKPFMVTDEKSPLYDCPNEKFSFYLIITTIRAIYEFYNKEENKKFEYPSVERIRDILYDFKYCSLSREAMISFVETFADNYGVGIEFILNNKPDISKKLEKEDIGIMLGITDI